MMTDRITFGVDVTCTRCKGKGYHWWPSTDGRFHKKHCDPCNGIGIIRRHRNDDGDLVRQHPYGKTCNLCRGV
jgi:DnaJ-class molecular chaperone